MGVEIERKFLLRDQTWRPLAHTSAVYRQGYLASGKEATVRVRVAADQGWLTIKGPTQGLSRSEFEYEIPVAEAAQMLESLCRKPLIEKTRHLVDHAGHRWEIDEFAGENAGLIVAEIELASAAEIFVRPSWIGEEVSQDPRYFNAALARNPYSRWGTRDGA